uniref:Uncharacterized protein n=1 Tax=Lepeophtheirus salmonis TaxID=72036 RepID=A0A0K2V3U5_LEPSM
MFFDKRGFESPRYRYDKLGMSFLQ